MSPVTVKLPSLQIILFFDKVKVEANVDDEAKTKHDVKVELDVVVEEEEAETEEVVLEEVDEEIETLYAESQSLIADSILVELDDEEV